jgi:hypothetical protein
MSTHTCTEELLVEQPAIGLVAELGWPMVSAQAEIFGPPRVQWVGGAGGAVARVVGAVEFSAATGDHRVGELPDTEVQKPKLRARLGARALESVYNSEWAFCAKTFPPLLKAQRMIRYDLGCYACQLGNHEEAWDWLEDAFDLGDPKQVKLLALYDPDLEPFWLEGAVI